jgi:hypothetical protein
LPFFNPERHGFKPLYTPDLSQLSEAVGVCYLRLRLSAEKIDDTGLLVESVDVSATPR